MPTAHIPIMSNNPFFTNSSFDFYEKGSDDTTPMVLRSKEESAPSHTFNTYWSSYWGLSNISNRFSGIENSYNLIKHFYLPFFTEYAEYDFRNWASIELMEDSFWESPYSSSFQDEYFSIKQNASNADFCEKQELLFNTTLRMVKDTKLKAGSLTKPFFKDLTGVSINCQSLPVFSEEPFNNSQNILTKDLNLFPNEISIDSSEEGYESAKYVNYIYYTNYKNILNGLFNSSQPISYATVFDSFRSDYEDPYLYMDDVSNLSSDTYLPDIKLDSNNNLKLSNPFKLRSTVKNSIVTYSAIQKVFRSRFDEGRSNTRLEDFSNSYVKHPYITDSRSKYESLLGKNKESFVQTNFYNQSNKVNFSNLSSLFYSNNIYFMDLPFLVSMKSDASRYLWFDWQSKWSSIEIAASSVSRYSLLGVPYSNKSFEYTTGLGDDLDSSETYLLKLNKARKNYGSSWAFSPYFFSRISNWYSTDYLTENSNLSYSSLSTRVFLKNSSLYWNSLYLGNKPKTLFTPTRSDLNNPGRSHWRPLSGFESFNYSEGTLVDILSKREYIYRHLYSSKGFKPILPSFMVASPANPLLTEISKLNTYTDPISISSESSRDLFYLNTSSFNFSILQNFFNKINLVDLPLNITFISNYFLFYFTGVNNYSFSDVSSDFYKNQYRPMKKGVSNMVKLHATGAIAMPTEVRMHLLASSKDVIHSWAIPSAGIKIDCVPGYSSHRIVIFLVSGIFWGQCMEICGRFHHWMPIIVFFLKRDLFFLWCTHFMHFSTSDNNFLTTDRQLCDYIKPASFSNSSWVSDTNMLT
jgi:heme/copper-type cytochrome/quinol oxidase subunit 2